MNQIMNQTRERVGTGPNNFTRQLPAPDCELAQQIAKDPYVFDFLGLAGEVAERDMEQAPMDRIVDTVRELGAGFKYLDDTFDPDELVTNDAVGGQTVVPTGPYAGPEGSEPLEASPVYDEHEPHSDDGPTETSER
jgi:hypothetical protein